MKQSHRKILGYLMAGSDIWAPYNSKLAFVVLPADHPQGDLLKVRVSTLNEMTELGLIENRFGKDNQGGAYSDSIWALPR